MRSRNAMRENGLRTLPLVSPQRSQSAQRFFLKRVLCGSLCALWLFVCLLLAGVTLTAQRGGGPPGGGAKAHPAIGNREAIAEGEKLYNETCTACHGKDGKGGELGPPVASQNRRYLRRSDDEIFDALKNGISGTQMPPFAQQFNEDQIWRITAYIRGLRGTAADTPAAGNVAGGETIFWGKGTCGN